jgi:arylsulfatase
MAFASRRNGGFVLLPTAWKGHLTIKLRKGRDVTPAAGQSFAPLFRTAAFPSNRPLFWEHMGNAAMRQGPWKLVRSKGRPWELYNLEQDRSELHNVATEHAEVVGRMKPVWKKWARTVGAL